MSGEKYIGLDVHQATISALVFSVLVHSARPRFA